MVQEQWKELEMNFLLGYSIKIVTYRVELTYGRGGGGGLLGEKIGIFPGGGGLGEQISSSSLK